jgi:metallo-beta-lactamase class B
MPKSGIAQRNRAWLVFLPLGIGAIAAALWGLSKTDPPSLNVATLVPRAVPLASGIYLLGRSAPSVVYAVSTSEGLVLIDSGLESNAENVMGQLSSLQLDVHQLRAILLTHVHGDHSLGAAHLRALTGAKVYAGRGDGKPLREGRPWEAFFSTFHMPHVNLHETPVDVELDGQEIIEFGDTRFVAIGAPGHTPGSVCYLLEREELRALFTGDVVQCLSPRPQRDLGTYAAYLPPRYRGNARDYLSTFQRLRALPAPDLVLPGHPSMDSDAQNPRITGERWRRLMDQGIHEMKQLLARFEVDGADFLDGGHKELLPGLHYLGDVEDSAVYCLDCPKGLFLFDAPGGRLLVDFLAARFQELRWKNRKVSAVFLTSASQQATAGLQELVSSAGCKVVVPKGGVDAVRRLCPPATEILIEDDVVDRGWLDVRMIPLSGRGLAPTAYELKWAGKTVLISGRIPMKLTAPSLSVPALRQLQRDVTSLEGNSADYLESLGELRRLTPDLWLPAVPLYGQNANLYDHDWATVIAENLRAIQNPAYFAE